MGEEGEEGGENENGRGVGWKGGKERRKVSFDEFEATVAGMGK